MDIDGGKLLEATMMLCFWSSWVFAIARSWRSRSTGGKSIIFLWVILAGYVAGMLNKTFFNFDNVIWLYALNSVMVSVDIGLYFRNRRYERRAQAA